MALETLTQFNPDQKSACSLFDFPPDWTNTVTKNPASGIESISLGNVTPQIDTAKESLNGFSFSFSYQVFGYENLKDFQDFFITMKGMNSSFCLPSWTADVTLASPAFVDDTSIVVKSTHAHVYPGCNLFFYTGDQYFTMKVDSIVSDNIVFTTSLPVDLPENFDVSIVYRVTFGNDSLDMNFITNDKATVSLTFVEERRESSQEGDNIS